MLVPVRKKTDNQLCLQESYFYNMHLLAPYFTKLVLQRLKDTYCTPAVEMPSEVLFFRFCTVSSKLLAPLYIFWELKLFSSSCPCPFLLFSLLQIVHQEFVLAVIPFVFEIGLETDEVCFGWKNMYSLLERFLPPYFYSDWHVHLEELLKAGRTIRICAVTQTPRKLFLDTLSKLKVRCVLCICTDLFVRIHEHLLMILNTTSGKRLQTPREWFLGIGSTCIQPFSPDQPHCWWNCWSIQKISIPKVQSTRRYSEGCEGVGFLFDESRLPHQTTSIVYPSSVWALGHRSTKR